jgi:cytochrome c553
MIVKSLGFAPQIATLMKPFAPLLCFLFAATVASQAWAADAPPASPKPDLAKGQASATAVCGACHTSDGSRGSPANPILQGQHPEYLAKQLIEYKSGKRDNAIMKGMASILSDADMTNVAAFYASKQAKPGFAKSKELVALGEKIYRGGIAERSVPACSGCHSPTGAGIPSQYPRMAGQHADYTEAQLIAFRGGVRKNSTQMTGVAAKMNDREIKAVSDYIAGLR